MFWQNNSNMWVLFGTEPVTRNIFFIGVFRKERQAINQLERLNESSGFFVKQVQLNKVYGYRWSNIETPMPPSIAYDE